MDRFSRITWKECLAVLLLLLMLVLVSFGYLAEWFLEDVRRAPPGWNLRGGP